MAMKASARRLALHQRLFFTPFSKPTGVLTDCIPTRDFPIAGWPLVRRGWYLGPLRYEKAAPMLLGAEATAQTAAYPPAMCRALAIMLIGTLTRRVQCSVEAPTPPSFLAGTGEAKQITEEDKTIHLDNTAPPALTRGTTDTHRQHQWQVQHQQQHQRY